MSVLSREEFFERLSSHIGDSTSDDSIAFMEDMTDTYNSLSEQSENDANYWKDRCEKIDEAWKTKYKHRFFSGGSMATPDKNINSPEGNSAEDTTIDDLFK